MPSTLSVLLKSNLPGIPLVSRGKVRDIYAVDDQRLLIIATDRLSAFDVVLPTGIPDKGRVLTQLSLFWYQRMRDSIRSIIFRHHLISANPSVYPMQLKPFHEQLEGRSMLVRKLKMVPVECVVRGFLAGSGWKEYQQAGTVCGHKLPAGLRESDKLPEPIFTPSTKAESGHDENITMPEVENLVGKRLAQQLESLSLSMYIAAAEYARMRGIIIADTKFEFGLDTDGGNLVIADEVLTPDSSRFWDEEKYEPGRPQDSFDKQYVRDYLETLTWDKTPPGPELPDDVVTRTREKYLEAYQRITGKVLE